MDEIGEVSSGEDSASSNEDIESGKEFSCLSCGRIFKTTFALLQHVDKNKKNDCIIRYKQSYIFGLFFIVIEVMTIDTNLGIYSYNKILFT